jgi:hypothetical protein
MVVIFFRCLFEIKDILLQPISIRFGIETRPWKFTDVLINFLVGGHQLQEADDAENSEVGVVCSIGIEQFQERKDDLVARLEARVPILANTVRRRAR